MDFNTCATYFKKIEETSSRLETTELLADMLAQVSASEVDKLVYLSLGTLGSLYNKVEFNISDKLLNKIIAEVVELEESVVIQEVKMSGDPGDYVYAYLSKAGLTGQSISVSEVYDKLLGIASAAGSGSQEKKISGTAQLLKRLDPLSAKYVVRIPIGKMRLGFSDVTILDALSWMISGDKSHRSEIERAYNVSADVGRIAYTVKQKGIDGLADIAIQLGIPIRPAAAERLPTAEAIIEKLGEVAAEPKIDGFRLQCHYAKQEQLRAPASGTAELDGDLLETKQHTRIYSRNLEDMTHMFPDLVQAIEQLGVDSIIFEGEAVAFNPDTEEFLPFQETIQRRRKHQVSEKVKEIPLRLFGFDLLYLNGESYINTPYQKRRELLNQVLSGSQGDLQVIKEQTYRTATELSEFFLAQIEHGLEGIMAKRLDAPYAAGARNYNWVKFKREEKSELNDSIDCVVMGYKYGKGRRTGFGIGAFLVGIYNRREDVFETVSNVGTGLTDMQWQEMKQRADELKLKEKPIRYEVPKELEQDVWLHPEMVVEILADEITRSPLHTAGKHRHEQGYALRFPRLVRWRDKTPEQATTVNELMDMFSQQKHR